MSGGKPGLLACSLRSGHPDFLDLPWHLSLEDWTADTCARFVDLPAGDSRHAVVFVSYDDAMYALKELPPPEAEKEHDLLRRMEALRLPVVEAIGHARTRIPVGEASVLITRYLDYSLPYQSLFMRSTLVRYREYLLDAMAGLLVQIHLSGVFWGDCSLNNTLFRRDAGRLTAYLVDAETSEIHPRVSDGMRGHDLDIMEENVVGGLLDLTELGVMPREFPLYEVGGYIRDKYDRLWDQVTRKETINTEERYRIQDRIQALNELGFSIEDIELVPGEGGDHLRLGVSVADRHHHRHMLHSITGIDPEEMQARAMLNEIRGVQAWLSAQQNRSLALSAAAHHWLQLIYKPTMQRLSEILDDSSDPAELYCEVLEHKWYLSELAKRDVGHIKAAEDFVQRRRST